MSYPQVRLVDSPSASATVLFDFNDDTAAAKRAVLDDGFSLGVPDLVGDVDAVDPLYGPRTVSFTLRLTGTKANALAAQSALARRLLAGPGWLQVRLHATSDLLFFRTYRAQPGDLSFERVMSTAINSVDDWDLEVNLPCEPFAYGERVTQAAYVVNNNPTFGLHPMEIPMGTFIADAPTPLRIEAVGDMDLAGGDFLIVTHASSIALPPINKAVGSSDGLTAGTDTAAGSAGASDVGGSARVINFSTNAALVPRLTGTVGPLRPGKYKVLVRMSGGTDQFTAQMTFYSAGPVVAVQSGGGWVDLGEVELPRNRPEALEDQGPNVTHPFTFSAGRTSPSGTLRVDHILLVPIGSATTHSSRVLRTKVGLSTVTTAQTAVWDGESERFWVKTTSTGALVDTGTLTHQISGAFPMGVPGVQNHLTIIPSMNAPSDSISRTTTLTVSYYPKFLYIGDS